MHDAKRERISSLVHTSAQDACVSLTLMLQREGPAYTLEICAAALIRLDATCVEKVSHRKVFATAARKALKQLEKGPLT